MSTKNTTLQSASHFVRQAMKRYGEEVILNRSLPRLEDGLRPVQRLLFWSCRDIASERFIKSAKITGHCIASYSPHGEKAAYDSLVRMVTERYPLAEGQGNFGSATTMPASARYTESRLHPFGRKLIGDLPDIQVVPYEKNYDDSLDQPVYLPCVLPNILLNPGVGVAVAITSKIAGFNLAEVAAAVREYLESGDPDKAIKRITAPDNLACKILSPKKEIKNLIKTGEGTLEYECIYSIQTRGSRNLLIVSGYAPEFSVSGFLSKCGALQDQGLVEAVRNETSETNGDRIVVEYRDAAAKDRLIKLLRKKVSYKFNVLVQDGEGIVPRQMGCGDIIKQWCEVRRNTVKATINKAISDQETALKRERAKYAACSNRDGLFRALDDPGDFRAALIRELGIDSEDADIIARMQVETLKKASATDIAKNITAMSARLDATSAKLGDIDGEIVSQINALMRWVKSEYPDLLSRKTITEEQNA